MLVRYRVAFLTAMLVLVAFLPLFAGAQLPKKIVSCTGVDCKICDIATTAQNVLNTGIYIAIFLSAVLFAWAGWKYVTAGGEGGKSAGKEIFTNVLIGLVIILAAWLIIDTLMKLLFKSTQYGPWNKIC